MRSSNPPLHMFVEAVGWELIGICIDKLGNEDFYGFVGIPPLHMFVEVVGWELVGICIDKPGNEDFYGFVGIHVGHLLRYMKFLLELGFEVFKSMNTCWVLKSLLTSPLVFMFGL